MVLRSNFSRHTKKLTNKYVERVMGRDIMELVERLSVGEAVVFRAGEIAITEFEYTRLSDYRAVVEVPERIYRVERRVYSLKEDEFFKRLVREVRAIMEEMERTEYFESILTALDDGVTLDMLKREELKEEYRNLLLKYKLIRIKWGKTILTWRRVVFIKLIKRI